MNTTPEERAPHKHSCKYGDVRRAEDGRLSYTCEGCGENVETDYYFRATERKALAITPERQRSAVWSIQGREGCV